MRGKRVLVTGASGHLGAHLVPALLSAGSEVLALIGPTSDPRRLASTRKSIRIVRGDVRDESWRKHKAFSGGVDVIYHLAAAGIDPKRRQVELMMDTNIKGTLNALEAARSWKSARFVYCGSSAEYPAGPSLSELTPIAPVSEYGVSKAAGGLLANAFFRRYGVPVVSVRPFMLYGPMEAPFRLVSLAISSALKGRDVELSDGNQKKDWVYVGDAAEALVAAGAVSGIEGEAFNVSSGRAHSVREVVEETLRQIGGSARPLFGAVPRRAEDVDVHVGNPDKARRLLGWKARTGLRDGVKKTIEWHRRR